VRIFLRRRDDDSLDFRGEAAVCIGNRTFILKIKHVSDSSDYMSDSKFAADVDGQSVILDDLDSIKSRSGLTDDVYFLVVVVETALVLIDTDCHDKFVKHGQSSLENIEVTGCEGVKRTRKKNCAFHISTNVLNLLDLSSIAMDVRMEQSWKEALKDEFDKDYFAGLVGKLHAEKAAGKTIFPPGGLIFRAFDLCPLDKVKVVILGQDPYHGYGQAMGLSFSVPDNVPAPPSLKNIFKEIENDLGVKMSGTPNLEPWALQGVLLLNAVLTVRSGEPTSHSNIGWQTFTDAVIKTISERCDGVVFLLWGNYARSKAPLIDASRHHVLEAAHPSPLARGAFFGCRHFSRTNQILEAEGKSPVNWQL